MPTATTAQKTLIFLRKNALCLIACIFFNELFLFLGARVMRLSHPTYNDFLSHEAGVRIGWLSGTANFFLNSFCRAAFYGCHRDERTAQEVSPDVVDKYGIISFKQGSSDQLDNIVEKPEKGTAPSNLASYGRYLLKPSVFKYLVNDNTGKDGELWTVDAITKAAAEKSVLVQKTKGMWMTTGDPENYFHAHLKFVLTSESYGAKVRGWVDEMAPAAGSAL